MDRTNEHELRCNGTLKPIYCADCKNRQSFRRYKKGDVVSDIGLTVDKCYKCQCCGHTTLVPVARRRRLVPRTLWALNLDVEPRD